MERKEVLTKLDKNEVTEWLNSFVYVNKPDGHLRTCLDPTRLNPYIIRLVCNSYTLDDIPYILKDVKGFTVVDANKGFFQLPLHEDSKKLTAMLTPYGVYVYNVLAMGFSLFSGVCESNIRDKFKAVAEHDRNLLPLLDK